MKTFLASIILLGVALNLASPAAYAQNAIKIRIVNARPTQTIDGQTMFREYCAVCHGEDLKGNGPAAEALVKAPADLTQIARKNGGTFPRVKVMRMIDGADVTAAHGTRAMPVWGHVFRSLENQNTATLRVNSLMEYVEKLQAN